MTHIQQLKIALPYGRTHTNLRFKATDEEVGLSQPQQYTLHNYVLKNYHRYTLHNYDSKVLNDMLRARKWDTLHNY